MALRARVVDDKLASLNIALPESQAPVANYDGYAVSNRMVHVSGQIPVRDGQLVYTGKVGADVDVVTGYESARLCGINIIAQLKDACDGNLDRVKKVVKLTGYVNCNSDFTQHPQVINGASDLMGDVFGKAGRHARSAVGVSSLPFNVPTEIEGIFEIDGTRDEVFENQPQFDKRGVPLEFKKGMKVEALDRSFKDIITVATIKEIDGNRVLLGFDGWPDTYDYWLDKDDGDFQPPGTCMRANARLSPPNGYVGYFDWGSYVEETDSVPAPPAIFASSRVFPSYKGDVSQRFELWHRMEATVVPVPPSPEQQEREAQQKNK